MLGWLDAYMADDQIAALMKAFGGTAAPVIGNLAKVQQGVYGTARFEQLGRLINALQSVRDQYMAAFENARGSGNFYTAVPRMAMVAQEVGNPVWQQATAAGEIDPTPVPVFDRVFDAAAFTDWYESQPGLANKAFSDFYGRAANTWEVDDSGQTQLTGVGFDNPDASVDMRGHRMWVGKLVPLDLNHPADLIDNEAIAFDPMTGCFGTSLDNLKDTDGGWFETAFMIAAAAGIAAIASPMAAGWATSAGLASTATVAGVTTTTFTLGGAMLVGGTVAAATSFTSGFLNGKFDLHDIFKSALAGMITGGATNGLTGFQAIAARTLVQGGVQAATGGKFEEGALSGLVSSLALEFGSRIEEGIQDALAQRTLAPEDLFAARAVGRVLTSSFKMLEHPDNPGYAFASEFINEMMPQANLSSSAVTPPPVESGDAAIAPADYGPTGAAGARLNRGDLPVSRPKFKPEPERESVYEADDDRLRGTPPKIGVVGAEGARGAWGIAQSLADQGASPTDVNRLKNQLVTLNPELAGNVYRGQPYVMPEADTAESQALAQQADQRYRTQQEAQALRDDQRQSQRELSRRESLDGGRVASPPLKLSDAFANPADPLATSLGSSDWFRPVWGIDRRDDGVPNLSIWDEAAEATQDLANANNRLDVALAAAGPVLTGAAKIDKWLGASPAVVDGLAEAQAGLVLSMGGFRGSKKAAEPVGNVLGRQRSTRGTAPSDPDVWIGDPVVRSTNPLGPVQETDMFDNEIYYRSMTEPEYQSMRTTGELPPATETSISPELTYSSKYRGIVVKLVVQPGTSNTLQEIGIAANPKTIEVLPDLSLRPGSWMETNARFKIERGQMTTQVGQGIAVDIFNDALVSFRPVRKEFKNADRP